MLAEQIICLNGINCWMSVVCLFICPPWRIVSFTRTGNCLSHSGLLRTHCRVWHILGAQWIFWDIWEWMNRLPCSLPNDLICSFPLFMTRYVFCSHLSQFTDLSSYQWIVINIFGFLRSMNVNIKFYSVIKISVESHLDKVFSTTKKYLPSLWVWKSTADLFLPPMKG